MILTFIFFIMDNPTTEERRKRLFQIMEQINNLNKEMDDILEGRTVQNGTRLPEDLQLGTSEGSFNQTEVIKNVIASSLHGIQKQQIIKAVKNQYGRDLTAIQVQSTLAYLKNTKKEIQSAGYGRYKIVNKES